MSFSVHETRVCWSIPLIRSAVLLILQSASAEKICSCSLCFLPLLLCAELEAVEFKF